jgi:hypothetical protein
VGWSIDVPLPNGTKMMIGWIPCSFSNSIALDSFSVYVPFSFPSLTATWIYRPLVNIGLSELELTSWTHLVKAEIGVSSLIISNMDVLISSQKVNCGSVCSIILMILEFTRPSDA